MYADTISGVMPCQSATIGWKHHDGIDQNAIHARHAKKANFQHVDGSVGSYSPSEIARRYRFSYNTLGVDANSGYAPVTRYAYQVVIP